MSIRDPFLPAVSLTRPTWVGHLVNFIFHGLHVIVIVFTLFGWAWRVTRPANLILILLTLGSWYILGHWFGEGYCPLTDWHWKVRRKMGISEISDSYVKLVFDRVTGKSLDPRMINDLTLVLTLVSGTVSLVMNLLGLT